MLGGDTDKDDLYVAPTIIVDVNNDDVVMQEEVHIYFIFIVISFVFLHISYFIYMHSYYIHIYKFIRNM